MDIKIYAHDSHDYIDNADGRHYEFEPQEARSHIGLNDSGEPIGIDYSTDDSYIVGVLTGLPAGTQIAETRAGDLALFLPGEAVGWSASECVSGAMLYSTSTIRFVGAA